MSVLFYLANALVVPPVIFFIFNFYKFKGSEINFRRLWISIIILGVTVIITSLQFVFPGILTAFDRNRDALLAGEVWRIITPLFIQPAGLWQCLFNTLFFLSVPIAEHLYGRWVLLIYFITGMAGQMVNFYWETTPGGLPAGKGGSSTALFGVIGSLFMYILLNQKLFPKGYNLMPIAAFTGAGILVFFEDGHAPSLLVGGLLGLLLRNYSYRISMYPQMKTAKQ